MDFETSAPTTRLPTALEPSSKVAVTLGSPLCVLLDKVLSLLPYYSRHFVSKLRLQYDIDLEERGIRSEHLCLQLVEL